MGFFTHCVGFRSGVPFPDVLACAPSNTRITQHCKLRRNHDVEESIERNCRQRTITLAKIAGYVPRFAASGLTAIE